MEATTIFRVNNTGTDADCTAIPIEKHSPASPCEPIRLYGDGREKTREATSSEIQRLDSSASSLQAGEAVKVYSDSQKKWLPGKVQEVLYTVEYADGVVKTLPSGSKCLSKHCPAGGMSNSKGEETSKVQQLGTPVVAFYPFLGAGFHI